MGMTTILIFEHHVDSTKQFKVWIYGWQPTDNLLLRDSSRCETLKAPKKVMEELYPEGCDDAELTADWRWVRLERRIEMTKMFEADVVTEILLHRTYRLDISILSMTF